MIPLRSLLRTGRDAASAPLGHDPADGLGLFGRDPALHMHQAPRAQALAVAALFLGVA
ncbi:MAG TPA: hypothetical protein P5284_03390 [Candidatus Contendobacter sp.]|nr:hypothetical protein [Candidatus Contendobacter sp.]